MEGIRKKCNCFLYFLIIFIKLVCIPDSDLAAVHTMSWRGIKAICYYIVPNNPGDEINLNECGQGLLFYSSVHPGIANKTHTWGMAMGRENYLLAGGAAALLSLFV